MAGLQFSRGTLAPTGVIAQGWMHNNGVMADDFQRTGFLEYFSAAAHERAARYRDRAAQLRAMAAAEPIGRLREGLLDLSRQFEALADTLDTKLRP